MPIPTGGAWPPLHVAPAYHAYRDWDAWYVGDPDKLRIVYNGRGATGYSTPPSQHNRPNQQSSGVIGRLSRWLWGTPASDKTRDARFHCPLPADLASTAANLLFSEPPKLSSATPAIQDRLEILVEDGINATFLTAAEADSALGDVYFRPVIDEEVFGRKAVLTAIHADGAIPTIRWDRLIEVTFWQCLQNDGSTYIRLLEHHDVVTDAAGKRHGRITYALHQGTRTELGRAIPLTEHPNAAYLAKLVDANGAQFTKLSRLDVIRVPNTGPQRAWRTNGTLKYLGRSDFDGNTQVFDQIDEAWTSWMRDIRLAKARITAPEYMLESLGAGKGAVWDADREVYSAVNSLAKPTDGGGGLTISQFKIRHIEHKATIDELSDVAMRHSGLSGRTLGEVGQGGGQKTATEVQTDERQSFITRGNRIQTWKPKCAEAIELLLEVEKVHFGGPDPVKPDVEFADSVSESPETTARTAQLLRAAEAASTKTLVEMLHPDWEKTLVDEEVQRIDAGRGLIQVQNPDTFTGANPAPPNANADSGDHTQP